MKPINIGIVYWVSLVLAALRVQGAHSEAFQAIAHLWVGALLAGWLVHKSDRAKWLVIGLSCIEVAAFVAQHAA